jgi:hypothetical protein
MGHLLTTEVIIYLFEEFCIDHRTIANKQCVSSA